jgi:CheY-like chemotaxis protein
MAEHKGTSVLVVDDDETIRDMLRFLLEEEGYIVYEAADGEAALARLRAHPCGMVVLLDLNLPSLDGASVLAAIVAEPPLAARHAFLLMTADDGMARPAISALLVALGMRVVTKPFGIARILAAVARAARTLAAPAAEQVAAEAPSTHGISG